MEDEWGNDWMDGAVPGGVEIAHVMLEIQREHGWAKMWANYEGLHICPRVRVWLDGYQDHDYEQVFLLRVWTESEPVLDPGPDYYGHTNVMHTVTLTDHLAVYQHHDGVDVEWRNDPRLFFDADSEWSYEGLRWWVDWTESSARSRREAEERDHPLPEETLRSLAKHNFSVSQHDRDLAIRLGLKRALPYLTRTRSPGEDC
jgi:hypothetical protein